MNKRFCFIVVKSSDIVVQCNGLSLILHISCSHFYDPIDPPQKRQVSPLTSCVPLLNLNLAAIKTKTSSHDLTNCKFSLSGRLPSGIDPRYVGGGLGNLRSRGWWWRWRCRRAILPSSLSCNATATAVASHLLSPESII